MTFEKVDPNQLAGIVAKGDTPTKRRKPATTVDTSVRDHQTWFKLKQTFGNCSNKDCLDPRLVKNGGDKNVAMVATINEKDTCRFCFLAGYLL